jgi:hypothetical protein
LVLPSIKAILNNWRSLDTFNFLDIHALPTKRFDIVPPIFLLVLNKLPKLVIGVVGFADENTYLVCGGVVWNLQHTPTGETKELVFSVYVANSESLGVSTCLLAKDCFVLVLA